MQHRPTLQLLAFATESCLVPGDDRGCCERAEVVSCQLLLSISSRAEPNERTQFKPHSHPEKASINLFVLFRVYH